MYCEGKVGDMIYLTDLDLDIYEGLYVGHAIAEVEVFHGEFSLRHYLGS